MYIKKVWIFLILLVTVFASTLSAQEPEEPDLNDPAVKQGYRPGRNDSTRGRFSTDGDSYQYVEDSEFLNDTDYVPPTKNPKLAGWLSFALPGSGQFYNGQYWKIPIIYGTFGTLIYVSQFYNVRYKQLKNDERYYLAITAGGDPSYTGVSFYNLTNEADIVHYMRKYRRYRDLCYLGTFLVYMMNIFDAVVDAHLYDYNVTDDIAMRLEPYAAPDMLGANAVMGARLVIRF
ncbi:MAG: hypothetical protein IKQ46_01680 [Bacteroidales bacterium]|jgi:hypothetical protein|nr:hypothetical protein [Bacteroidales bacterium]